MRETSVTQNNSKPMKTKLICVASLAATLAVTANASIYVFVACADGLSALGIPVILSGPTGLPASATTDANGVVKFSVTDPGSYVLFVPTPPPDATLLFNFQSVMVTDPSKDIAAVFPLEGLLCQTTPNGTVCFEKVSGTFTFVPKADIIASVDVVVTPDGRGQLNVVDRLNDQHFQATDFHISSFFDLFPEVSLMDAQGGGTLSGIAGNPQPKTPANFVWRVFSTQDGNQIYLQVADPISGVPLLQIGNSLTDMAPFDGNVQIHCTDQR
jgi:hypothetical protein